MLATKSIVTALSLAVQTSSAGVVGDEPVPPPEVAPPAPEASLTTTPAPAPTVFPPRWNGNTLFGTGAFTAALGMALHGVSAYGIQRECAVAENPSDLLPSKVRDLGIGDVLDSTFLANIDVICSPEVALAAGARVVVPLLSAGSIGQITAGGAFRGYKMGYDDAFTGQRRSAAAMMGVGGVLMLAGATLWAGSRGSIWENRTGCDTIECVVWYDFGTFQGSSILFSAGTGLVAQGLNYKQSRERYERWKNIDVRPMLSRNQAGLVLNGRF